MYLILLKLTLFVHLVGITGGFLCYQCSYDTLSNVGKDWNNPKCMSKPGELDKLTHYPCNDTGFCIFQETYSLRTKEVTSYYRQCSRTSLGNKCTEDATRLICTGACKGDFCTKNDTGRQHVKYYGSASSMNSPACPVFIYMFLFLCVHFLHLHI